MRAWRLLPVIAVLLAALVGCSQSSPPATPALSQAIVSQSAAQSFTPLADADEYVKATVETISSERTDKRTAALDAFIEFAKTNAQFDEAVKQQIAQQLLDKFGSLGLPAARQAGYRQELQTVARGGLGLVPTPPGPRALTFPADDGAHRDLTEWWYYTGHLQTKDGKRYGYELTFFRVLPVIYFAHLAITDEQTGKFTYARHFFKPSDVSLATGKLDARYKNWSVQGTGSQQFRLKGSVEQFSFTFDIRNKRPQPLLIDGDGYLAFPYQTFTYYYSLTRMETTGQLQIGGQPQAVTGTSWMDHQWGNFAPGWPITVMGWNWFSIQLDDGTEYNLFELLSRQGQPGPLSESNILRPDGSSELHQGLELEKLKIWHSPRTGKGYVTDWRLTIPATGEQLRITATMEDQEMARRTPFDIAPNYWEGSCLITRTTRDGKVTTGRGYTEQTRFSKEP